MLLVPLSLVVVVREEGLELGERAERGEVGDVGEQREVEAELRDGGALAMGQDRKSVV